VGIVGNENYILCVGRHHEPLSGAIDPGVLCS